MKHRHKDFRFFSFVNSFFPPAPKNRTPSSPRAIGVAELGWRGWKQQGCLWDGGSHAASCRFIGVLQGNQQGWDLATRQAKSWGNAPRTYLRRPLEERKTNAKENECSAVVLHTAHCTLCVRALWVPAEQQ